MKTLNVYALPQLFLGGDFEEQNFDPQKSVMQNGDTAIAIDVLRATTTIVQAISAGAKTVLPILHVEETLTLKDTILQGRDARFAGISESDLLLGGERYGTRIEGFDLGNSPLEYTPEKVAGKTILFSTTNGTKALCAAAQIANNGQFTDSHILPASFLNVDAVVDFVLRTKTSKNNETENLGGNVHIICAGTDGDFTEEDMYLAGLLVEQLQKHSRNAFQLNVQAVSVLEQWERLFPDGTATPQTLAPYLHESRGGKNLHKIHLQNDIDFAAKINSDQTIALLDPESLLIKRAP